MKLVSKDRINNIAALFSIKTQRRNNYGYFADVYMRHPASMS